MSSSIIVPWRFGARIARLFWQRGIAARRRFGSGGES